MTLLILISIYVFLLGLVLGSFFNVVALRVPEGLSVVRPPSACPHCQNRLKARDLIPLISYAWNRGRCRFCKNTISKQYPLVELATGLLFLGVYLRFGLSGESLVGITLVSLGVIVTVTDIKYMRIPNKILLVFIPLLFGLRLLFPLHAYWNHLLGAFLALAITLAIALLSGGMGMGDVKLFALFGLVLGVPQMIVAFIVACALGSLVGGILLATGKIQRKQPIPFAPWLTAGTWIAFAYGSQIIGGYFSLIS